MSFRNNIIKFRLDNVLEKTHLEFSLVNYKNTFKATLLCVMPVKTHAE